MMNTDEPALICDLAETYHIYEYRELPLEKVALFAVGLRESSRIKTKMSGLEYPLNTMLFAHMVDRLSILVWQRTEDGANGTNKPRSMIEMLNGRKVEEKGNDIAAFENAHDFEGQRQEILRGIIDG